MKAKTHTIFLLLISIAILTSVSPAQLQPGKVFTVNSTIDSFDSNPGDGFCADANGQCSLRAAVAEAGTTFQRDAIIFALPDPSTITLDLGRINADSLLMIVGPGTRRLTITRNNAASAFGIFNVSSFVTLRGFTISNGDAGFLSGGGIFVQPNQQVNLTDVAIINNRALSGAGIDNKGRVLLLRSLIAGNIAQGSGGGVFNSSAQGDVVVQDSTITNNQAESAGGILNNGDLWLMNATVSHNTANSNATQVSTADGNLLSTVNTILGGDPGFAVPALNGAFTSRGSNIVADPRNTTGFVDGINSDRVSVDPLLGPLQDNGGQSDTRATGEGSPARGNGDICVLSRVCIDQPDLSYPSRSDQRRIYTHLFSGPIDSGAFDSSAQLLTGVSSFAFTQFAGPAGRYLNGFTILTNVRTNQKLYTTIGPLGAIRFQNIPIHEIFAMEVRTKRPFPSQPVVIEF